MSVYSSKTTSKDDTIYVVREEKIDMPHKIFFYSFLQKGLF